MNTVVELWKTKIKPGWKAQADCTFSLLSQCSRVLTTTRIDVFDLLLTRDLSRAHIVDFNPYAPQTDSLLFSYEELKNLLDENSIVGASPNEIISPPTPLPEFRVIDSLSHPVANSKAPTNQHNMVPFEALSLSSGRDMNEFKEIWQESIKKSTQEGEQE